MLTRLQDKALEAYVSLTTRLASLKDERGQTSAEYIAVTAVAVLIAITVIYAVFSTQLSAAISTIGSELSAWVSESFAGAPPAGPAPE